MQLQKDVLIAGGVVVVCVALVVVALVATGKKDQPSDPSASGAVTDSYGSSSSSYDGSSYNSLGSGPAASGAPGDSFGMAAPPPGMPGDNGFGGGSTSPFGPTGSSTTPPVGGAFDNGFSQSPLGGTSNAGGSAFGGSSADPMGSGPTGSDPMATAAPASSAGGGTHTVAKGETLGDISATHYGTTKHWKKIVDANPGLDPARLKIGQVLQIPAVETSAAAPVTVAGGAGTHTVAKGESYYTIAKKELGSSSRWREIERLNGIPAESLKVGTVIKIPLKDQAGGTSPAGAPAGGGKTHIVSKGETLGDISKEYFGTTTKWKQIIEANPGVRPENLKVGQSLIIPDLPVTGTAPAAGTSVGGNSYTVKAGDTLESIAASTLGKKSAWKQIVEANPGLKPTALRVGQVIQIPGGTASPVPATPAPAGGFDSGFGPSPAPGAFGPTPGAPAAPAPAPQPTFQDDPFYSPYDVQPAAPAPAGPGANRI
jgi:nucleoid-associated protein YgaU